MDPKYDSSKEDSVDEDDQKLVIKEVDIKNEVVENENEHSEDNNVSTASSCDYNLSNFKDERSEEGNDFPEQDTDYEMEVDIKKEKESDDDDKPLVRIFDFIFD